MPPKRLRNTYVYRNALYIVYHSSNYSLKIPQGILIARFQRVLLWFFKQPKKKESKSKAKKATVIKLPTPSKKKKEKEEKVKEEKVKEEKLKEKEEKAKKKKVSPKGMHFYN